MKSILVILIVCSLAYAEQWQAWPWVSAEQRAKGLSGGEGGQIPAALDVGGVDDPNFAITGSDVGGLYRSTDFGSTWTPANVGFKSGGSQSIAVDPRNSNRILTLGTNSGPDNWNGIYLSTDKGLTWSLKLGKYISDDNDPNSSQIAYDESSYDAALKYCKVAYWSRPSAGYGLWGTPEVKPAIYKTTDGGVTWIELANTGTYAGGNIQVHPTLGQVYAANGTGVYKSTDGAVSFTRIYTGDVKAIDVVSTAPNKVWIATADGVYRSDDAGANWTKLVASGQGGLRAGWITNIAVSPANTDRLFVDTHPSNGSWTDYVKYVSQNGGSTWTTVQEDNSGVMIPSNGRAALFRWHTTKAGEALVQARGDWFNKTTDGGLNSFYSYNGVSALMQGGHFAWNADDPNLVLITTQDYNSAFTKDNGQTWQRVQFGAGWGGYQYGGYAASDKIFFAFKAEGWNWHKHIKITRDGGATWDEWITSRDEWGTPNGFTYPAQGTEHFYHQPSNTNILFAGKWRSTDQGRTWSLMNGCDGVVIHNPNNKNELWGIGGKKVVKSTDAGVTWTAMSPDISPYIDDIGIDFKNMVALVGGGTHLHLVNLTAKTEQDITGRVPADQNGNRRFLTVAVDPVDPKVMYAGGFQGYYRTTNSVVRSVDGGTTWQSITDGRFGGGGHEAVSMRVHPVTRYLHVGGMCHGLFKIGPPGSSTPADTLLRIVSQPQSSSISVGGSASFSVVAGGKAPFTYQWLKNGNILTGKTTTSLTLSSLTMADNGASFTVRVIDSKNDTIVSNAAILTVEAFSGFSMPQANAAPTLDGIAESVYTKTDSIMKVVEGSPVGTDGSGIFKAVWNGSKIYLWVQVRDADIKTDNPSTEPWADDGLEIYLDLDKSGGAMTGTGDCQFNLVYNASAAWSPGRCNASAVTYRSITTTGGYVIEASIDLVASGFTESLEGSEVRMDLAINDDDGGGVREFQRVWKGSALNWQVADGFGLVQFEQSPVRALQIDKKQGIQSLKGRVWNMDLLGRVKR